MTGNEGALYRAFSGFRLIDEERMLAGHQIRFPRSKRRRIQKKWRRRRENHVFYPDPGVLMDQENKVIIGHPVTMIQLRHKLMLSAAAAGVACAPITDRVF